MAEHELIAVVPDECTNAPDEQTKVLSAHGFTAVFAAAPCGVILLPKSRKTLLSEAAVRQAQLEALMAHGPVLAIAPRTRIDPAMLPTTIAANAPMLRDLCAWLQGAVQFQITVSWQPAEAMRHFRTAPELAPLFERPRVSASALDRAMTQLMKRLTQVMRNVLDPVVTDVIALPGSPEVLLNLCVLLRATDEGRLDRAVEEIDAIWSDGLTIRQIGPSPATAFALLHLSPVTAKEVAAARRILGIEAGTTDDIAEARRRALMSNAPDISAIRRAAEVLLAHARAGARPFHMMHARAQDQGELAFHDTAVA